jgi:hypothetical protein
MMSGYALVINTSIRRLAGVCEQLMAQSVHPLNRGGAQADQGTSIKVVWFGGGGRVEIKRHGRLQAILAYVALDSVYFGTTYVCRAPSLKEVQRRSAFAIISPQDAIEVEERNHVYGEIQRGAEQGFRYPFQSVGARCLPSVSARQ